MPSLMKAMATIIDWANVIITGGSISNIDDPVDEHGVGDRGFTDGRYLQIDEIIQATSDTLTVAEVKGKQISNYSQGAADNLQILPAAAEGMNCILICGTAQAAHYFGVQADTNDKIFLDGVAGSDNGIVKIAAPVVGAMLVLFAFQTGVGTFDWVATGISGTWVAA